MPKYSMPFIAKIHRFLKVCLVINKLEIDQNATYNYTQNSCQIFYTSPNYYKIEIEKLNQTTDILLRYIHQKSIKENFYFFDCPSQVYTNHYENRKQIFLKKYIDSTEIDFIESELHNLQQPKQHQMLRINYKCINKFLSKKNKELINFDHLRNNQNAGESIIRFNNKSVTVNYSQLVKTNDKWKYSYNKKIAFLNDRLNEFHDDDTSPTLQVKESKIEYQLTTNQTIILLDSAGFFSNPIFENVSKNKQSTLLGEILQRNSKKINESIGKLEKSPKENGKNYQKDITKVEQIINNLRK
jgi:hypothetical protein